eukprot:gene19693-26383_t
MGIPFYFRYLVESQNDILVDGLKHGCDYLCFDFNCLIHKCAMNVARSRRFKNTDELHDAVFATIRAYTEKVIVLLRPRLGVYIAIDGVPPLAKIQQQRKRRYLSVYERKFKHDEESLWNSNVVTPGTVFMEKMSSNVCYHIRSNVQVDVSDWSEPGEGEHKIFKFMEAKPRGSSVVIYGLDADMIMLSLMHPEHNIVLAREKEKVSLEDPTIGQFDAVDIQQLRSRLSKKIGRTNIHDYIVLCMLVGNDFLPPLSCLHIMTNDVDFLIDAYNSSKASDTDTLLYNRKELNYKMLTRIMLKLSEAEDDMMTKATNEYYKKEVPCCSDSTKQRQMEHSWKYYPLLYKFPRHLIQLAPNNGWRLQYYTHLFGPDCDPTHVVQSYLEGIEWNVMYYTGNCSPEAQWFYPYPYAPTIKDIYNYLVAKKRLDPSWAIPYCGKPQITPLVQLLAVIPPENKHLVPSELQGMYDDLHLGCVHFYPCIFKIITYLKHFSWEMVPLLPNIDIKEIGLAIERLREG